MKVSYIKTNIVHFYLYEVLDGSGLVTKLCPTPWTSGLPFPSATYEVLSQIHRHRLLNSGYQGWEEKRMKSYCLMGTEFQFGMMENFWRWMVVMVT